MYTLHIRSLGRIILHISTMYVCGAMIHVSGHDDDNNIISFIMDRFICPDDSYYEYGYCHIVSYIKDGILTACNAYSSIG